MGRKDPVHKGQEKRVSDLRLYRHGLSCLKPLRIVRRFINHHYHQTMEDFFPRMTMETLDAGHWGTFYSFRPRILILSLTSDTVHGER